MTQCLLSHTPLIPPLKFRYMDTTNTPHMDFLISLDAVVATGNISKSTLWRRVSEGVIRKVGKDIRNRSMLLLADVLPLVDTLKPMADEDIHLLLAADAGAADAQADVGAMFYIAGNTKAALYWLHEAAAQDNADAMHWLAIVHTAHASSATRTFTAESGHGLEASEHEGNMAMMWLAKAATLGHLIALQQMALLKRSGPAKWS